MNPSDLSYYVIYMHEEDGGPYGSAVRQYVKGPMNLAQAREYARTVNPGYRPRLVRDVTFGE